MSPTYVLEIKWPFESAIRVQLITIERPGEIVGIDPVGRPVCVEEIEDGTRLGDADLLFIQHGIADRDRDLRLANLGANGDDGPIGDAQLQTSVSLPRYARTARYTLPP